MGPARYAPRRKHVPYWLIAFSLLGAFAAVLPIVAAFFGDAPTRGARTAFADAPSGTYGVFTRPDAAEDIISVAPIADPSAVTEIARVPHLPGFISTGAVSPDGHKLALVTVDAGSPADPGASLLAIDLDSGQVDRLATRVDPLQTPTWAPASDAIIVSRVRSHDAGLSDVTFVRVALAGPSETPAGSFAHVLGAYAVGFDPGGKLVTVVIDARGSTAYRDFEAAVPISAQITRDWRLSPSGSQLAFIESDLSAGLHYRARVASLDGTTPSVQAQAGGAAGDQQLGVAWQPGIDAPTFGDEPPAAAAGGASAQTLASGFDIPLAYAPDGRALAVQSWSGSSFANPGAMQIAFVSGAGHKPLPGAARFYGWAAR